MRCYFGDDFIVFVDIFSFEWDKEFLAEFKDILFHNKYYDINIFWIIKQPKSNLANYTFTVS